MIGGIVYLVRWVWFVFRWIFAMAYRLVQFFSSRGSLLIVPVAGAVAMVEFRPELHAYLTDSILLDLRPGHVPTARTLDLLLVALLALGILVCKPLKRLLPLSGSMRTAVPLLSALALVQFRPTLHAQLREIIQLYPLPQVPSPIVLDGILVTLFLLAEILYQELSYLLCGAAPSSTGQVAQP